MQKTYLPLFCLAQFHKPLGECGQGCYSLYNFTELEKELIMEFDGEATSRRYRDGEILELTSKPSKEGDTQVISRIYRPMSPRHIFTTASYVLPKRVDYHLEECKDFFAQGTEIAQNHLAKIEKLLGPRLKKDGFKIDENWEVDYNFELNLAGTEDSTIRFLGEKNPKNIEDVPSNVTTYRKIPVRAILKSKDKSKISDLLYLSFGKNITSPYDPSLLIGCWNTDFIKRQVGPDLFGAYSYKNPRNKYKATVKGIVYPKDNAMDLAKYLILSCHEIM